MKKSNVKHNVLLICLCAIRILMDLLLIKYIKYIAKGIVMALLMAVVFFAMLIYYAGAPVIEFFTLEPPIPEIQYAEIPFEVVSSVDGEVYENSDVLVCEYESSLSTDILFSEVYWNEHLKSGDDGFAVCTIEDVPIYMDYGSAEHYMMPHYPFYSYSPGEYIYFYLEGERYELTLDEAKEKLNIEIVSMDFPKPLKNKLVYSAHNVAKMLFVFTVTVYFFIIIFGLDRKTKSHGVFKRKK